MPQPKTGTVCPPASSAARWAAPSMPRANPEMTFTPASARPAARARAARSHDGDRRGVGEGEAAREQDGRRIMDFAQEGGVAGVGQKEDARTRVRETPGDHPNFMSLVPLEQRRNDPAVLAF